MVGGTSFRYSSKPAGSGTSTSPMMYAGIGSASKAVSFRTSHIHPNHDRGEPMAQLEERTALITGEAGGIGAACARTLASEGARLVLADLDPGVEKVAAELGQVAVRADVTRREDIERMVEEPYR